MFYYNALWGQFGPTLSKKWGCEKTVEYHWSRTLESLDYLEKFISVSLNQSKTIDLQILKKNENFDSSKSSEYAATDTPTSPESSIESENILLQHNDEIHTARTYRFIIHVAIRENA